MSAEATADKPGIQWCRPWLAPYRDWGEALEKTQQAGQSVADGLNSLAGTTTALPKPVVHFVPSSSLPTGEAYEAFIHRTGTVPTRNNSHDLFNGLVWWRLPRAKRRLNELQAAEIAAQGVKQVRGALRDALTLFDENAALLQAPEPLRQALMSRDWRALFVTHRLLWADARITLFGHALMEKLVTPRKTITAHVWLLPAGDKKGGEKGDDLENLLLASLEPERLAAKPFHPLPVLGVPGWWHENESPAFYDDTAVFRPASKPAPFAEATVSRVARPNRNPFSP